MLSTFLGFCCSVVPWWNFVCKIAAISTWLMVVFSVLMNLISHQWAKYMTSAHLLYIEVRVEQRHEHYVVWYLPVTCISHFRCHSDIGSSFKGPSSLNWRSVISVNIGFFFFSFIHETSSVVFVSHSSFREVYITLPTTREAGKSCLFICTHFKLYKA